ncbi:hypothetical protein EBZ80_06320 [bacterium]|nr:hypothetical protein [bacterium]
MTTPTSAIVGWSGFVGQYLTQFFPESDLYNSGNIETLRRKTYDTIYFSAMPAEKWKINQNPTDDATVLSYFCELLTSVSCEEFILISTVDVLDCTIGQYEDGAIFAEHPYGRHRRALEDFVQKHFSKHIILRLPGLFGKGLKKNIIYDLLHDNQLEQICLDSAFQWYNLENLKDDIEYCRRNRIQLIQLVSTPIRTSNIVSNFFPDKLSLCKGTRIVKYQLETYFPLRVCEIILDEIGRYIEWYQRTHRVVKRLAISNIAWTPEQFHDINKILKRYDINQIEMAFTTLRPWAEWDDTFISFVRKNGYSYPSCQSILYNTGIEIFKEQTQFIEHYNCVLELCSKLGISRIVLGSPTGRHIYDTTEEERVLLFRRLGRESSVYGVTLCIEPNSTKYGCTWLTTLAETYAFVSSVAHPNVRINFDFGNYIMENDSTPISAAIVSNVGNVQISAPFLGPIDSSYCESYTAILSFLETAGYNSGISLEMRSSTMGKIIESCDKIVEILSLTI